MAPTNGAAKARKPAAGRQGPRPVVPALPLPYTKRKAAGAGSAEAAANASKSEAAQLNNTSAKSAKDPEPTLPTPNGLTEPTKETAETKTEQPVANGLHSIATSFGAGEPSNPSTPTMPSTAAASTPTTASLPEAPATSKSSQGSTAQHKEPEVPILKASPSTSKNEIPNVDTEYKHGCDSAGSDAQPRHAPLNATSTYQMPPPFQPGMSMGMAMDGDMRRPHRRSIVNGPIPLHQAHPSNSSVHFGGFVQSGSTSPAPPHSAGLPPPDTSIGVGHSNGFHPMMPYGVDSKYPPTFDNYGRPQPYGHAQMGSYPDFTNGFNPNLAHGYREPPQSVLGPDYMDANSQYGKGPVKNGYPEYPEDFSARNGRSFRAMQDPHDGIHHPDTPPRLAAFDDADGIISYMSQLFASLESADCHLEVQYVDRRAAPVRIPAHKIILARSPALAKLVKLSAPFREGEQPVLLLETTNKMVRSDSIYMALQRLYGLPLLSIPHPGSMDSAHLANAGSFVERFDFALSYAAAGQVLKWTPILVRGCEVAAQFLSWETLESAVKFAMDGYQDGGDHETYRYQEGSRIILEAVVKFVLRNLPEDFKVNSSADGEVDYARIPSYPKPAPPKSEKTSNAPAVARGSSVQLGKGGRRMSKINNIQFGDLALSDAKAAGDSPQAAAEQKHPNYVLLSRILLNLPTTYLRMILEVALGVDRWIRSDALYRVILDVVKEREVRRQQAIEAVKTHRISNWEGILRGLRNPGSTDLGKWTVLAWEEMVLHGNGGPSVHRGLVSLNEDGEGRVSEYP